MDGRNLANCIILKWYPEISLIGIATTIPVFIKNILTANHYEFYGEFSINAVYDLKNFNNMLVNNFPCHIDHILDEKKQPHLFVNDTGNFTLVISDDCLILFKHFPAEDKNKKNIFGKIVFWASLFAISDLQINKDRKVVRINFYKDDKEESLKLVIDNVLYLKETLIKKASNLKVRVDINKLIKGKYIENRITSKDVNNMNINQIEECIRHFTQKIQSNNINFYIVNTFSLLSGKAIEYYSKNDPEKQMKILLEMKNILQKDKVKEILTKNQKERNNDENKNDK